MKEKITIIGFGFLMGYLYPCYARLVGDELATHVIAVTADEGALEQKRRQYPFPVLLDDNAAALRRMEPDIILFAPPPSVAKRLAQEDLKPYFDELRAAGKPLPDLYVFPPSPQGDFYLETLGSDIQVCNILPNMTREIAGVDLHGAEGNTYISFSGRCTWDPAHKARLMEFFSTLGGVVEVPAPLVLDMLATLCPAEISPLLLFDLADCWKADFNRLAEAMRACHQDMWDIHPQGSTPCAAGGLPEEQIGVLRRLAEEWNRGAVEFLVGQGMPEENAKKIILFNFDLKLHAAQLQSREKTEQDLVSHATPGGVAERAKLCYELLVRKKIQEQLGEGGSPAEDFYLWIRDIIREMCAVISCHSRRMSGSGAQERFGPETHAALYGLFVRTAQALAGERGREAVLQGTLLYADQRGSRIAKTARAHGDSNELLNYIVYSEWAPEPGTMESFYAAYAPEAVQHVTKCPWYDTWKRLGMLEEGRLYCSCIDYNLVKGYNSECTLDVTAVRPNGDPYCEYIWRGLELTAERRKLIEEKKERLGESCLRDWLYHTRHLYSAMREKLADIEEGGEIVSETMRGFEVLCGAARRELVEQVDGMDFYAI